MFRRIRRSISMMTVRVEKGVDRVFGNSKIQSEQSRKDGNEDKTSESTHQNKDSATPGYSEDDVDSSQSLAGSLNQDINSLNQLDSLTTHESSSSHNIQQQKVNTQLNTSCSEDCLVSSGGVTQVYDTGQKDLELCDHLLHISDSSRSESNINEACCVESDKVMYTQRRRSMSDIVIRIRRKSNIDHSKHNSFVSRDTLCSESISEEDEDEFSNDSKRSKLFGGISAPLALDESFSDEPFFEYEPEVKIVSGDSDEEIDFLDSTLVNDEVFHSTYRHSFRFRDSEGAVGQKNDHYGSNSTLLGDTQTHVNSSPDNVSDIDSFPCHQHVSSSQNNNKNIRRQSKEDSGELMERDNLLKNSESISSSFVSTCEMPSEANPSCEISTTSVSNSDVDMKSSRVSFSSESDLLSSEVHKEQKVEDRIRDIVNEIFALPLDSKHFANEFTEKSSSDVVDKEPTCSDMFCDVTCNSSDVSVSKDENDIHHSASDVNSPTKTTCDVTVEDKICDATKDETPIYQDASDKNNTSETTHDVTIENETKLITTSTNDATEDGQICCRIALEQLSDRCQACYDDDTVRFLVKFLLPARDLLLGLQYEYQGSRRRRSEAQRLKSNSHGQLDLTPRDSRNKGQASCQSYNGKNLTPYPSHSGKAYFAKTSPLSQKRASDPGLQLGNSCDLKHGYVNNHSDLRRDWSNHTGYSRYNHTDSLIQNNHTGYYEDITTLPNNHYELIPTKQPHYPNWPVSTKDNVLIHLSEPNHADLKNGDSYFYVTQSGVGAVQLVLRHMTNGNIQEIPIPEGKRSDIFDMDKRIADLSSQGDEDISRLLSQCLVAAENSLERMSWDKVKLTALRSKSDNGFNFRILPAIRDLARDVRSSFRSKEARATYRKCADGSLVKEDTTPRVRRVRVPVRLLDVRHEVMSSGAAIMTSFYDSRKAPVMLIYCNHAAWHLEVFTAQELAKLMLYYQAIPNETARQKGLTIIVDARSTTLGIINCLLEGLYTVDASLPKAIHIVHILVDKVAQMLFFRSPVFRPHENVKIDLVSSIETMYKFVDRSKLPPQLGGHSEHDHPAWVAFRMKLEPFLNNCRAGAQFLVNIMAEVSSTQGMPHTARETSQLIEQHEQCVRKALEEPVLEELQLHGEDTLTMIKDDMLAGNNPEDYREYYEGAKRLFGNVKDSMFRLMKLADDKLHRLEQCLQLRQFEEQASQIINWLCTDGEDILKTHSHVADNLKAIRAQQADFDKAYFTAMTELEKGDDLVEEASMLGQSTEFEQVAGIKEISKELKGRLKDFSTQLDSARETIEQTAQCYQLLDQCYEWALEAMKYVAGMKMEKDMPVSEINTLLTSLDMYLSENPPIEEQIFDKMDTLANKLDNEKLLEQCKVAHSRCIETEQLLHIRRSTLNKSKEQIENEEMLEQERRDSVPSLNNGANGVSNSMYKTSSVVTSPTANQSNGYSQNFGPVRYRQPEKNKTSPVWEQQKLSSPVGPSLDYVSRRRSYAGKPSAPVYSPSVAAFKENLQGMNLREYEEHLFYEGLITEDMSDRIVANLPKGLSNTTMKNSRESLRGSQENMNPSESNDKSNSNSNIATAPANQNGLNSRSDGFSSNLSGSKSRLSGIAQYSAINALTVMLNRHSKPHKKVMRRSASCMMPSASDQPQSTGLNPAATTSSPKLRENPDQLREKRNGKSLSMTTSTDSLPSLPEEDTLDTAAQSEKRHTWAPVTVNPSASVLQGQRAGSAGVAHQSMADLRTAEEDIRRRRQLQLIMTELIDTERDYVRALQMVIDNYIPEVLRDDVPQSLRGKRNIVFGNIEHIYEFHSQYFLAELEACKTNPYRICHCFLNHEAEFYLYALYNKNKPKSDHLMAEHHGREFFRQKQADLGDKMDLSSYLLKPVQRMGKYSLLLKQIIKLCPNTEPDYLDLKTAYDVVKFQLRHGNDLLAMDCLTGADVNLNEQGMLLRQDTFLVWHGRRKAMRHVFLFEEMVVFSKTKQTNQGKEMYSYKSSIKTSDLGLTENVGDNSRYKFEIWFRKRTSSDNFILQTSASQVKNDWVKEISRLLWKQAIRNREMRLAEMQRMGAGSKPCIDLKPSKDNIQDRFVNISLVNRVPKMRSSIAVSSMDHLKNGNKRPHSLISVSSTSSSNSSGMYGGGPLSITFESPNEGSYEEMKGVPRSATICSNESGIVEDMSHGSNPSSPQHQQEDACTQTTLRRPPKKDISTALSSPTRETLPSINDASDDGRKQNSCDCENRALCRVMDESANCNCNSGVNQTCNCNSNADAIKQPENGELNSKIDNATSKCNQKNSPNSNTYSFRRTLGSSHLEEEEFDSSAHAVRQNSACHVTLGPLDCNLDSSNV